MIDYTAFVPSVCVCMWVCVRACVCKVPKQSMLDVLLSIVILKFGHPHYVCNDSGIQQT